MDFIDHFNVLFRRERGLDMGHDERAFLITRLRQVGLVADPRRLAFLTKAGGWIIRRANLDGRRR